MNIKYDSNQLNQLAKDYDINYLAVFGSSARGDNQPDSDIDILFDYSTPPGIFKLSEIQEKLQQLLGGKVDLVSKRGVSKYLRKYIKKDLHVLYQA